MNWPEDFMNKIICGDNLSVMKKMPDESIDMAITSPPYWGLRDYGTGPDQLGLEPNPELYIEHLTEIFNEVKRILKKEGTFWLNMGDTYGGSGQGSQTGYGDYKRQRIIGTMEKSISTKIMPKCLLMIPERLAWSLIQNGWILRNKIIWYKPNAMPSSVTDRFSNRWEYICMFSKNQRYYFDLDAVREKHLPQSIKRANGHDYSSGPWAIPGGINGEHGRLHDSGKNPGDVFEIGADTRPKAKLGNPSRIAGGGARCQKDPRWTPPEGKRPIDFWEINTQPFPEAHFAVFPEKLCEKPIKAGCPEEVCKKCGKGRYRITEKVDIGEEYSATIYPDKTNAAALSRKRQACRKLGLESPPSPKTIGWTTCNCNAGFESGIVLDPFAGAGTALYVAKELRRRFIGIDIKKEYCELAEKRLAQGVL